MTGQCDDGCEAGWTGSFCERGICVFKGNTQNTKLNKTDKEKKFKWPWSVTFMSTTLPKIDNSIPSDPKFQRLMVAKR